MNMECPSCHGIYFTMYYNYLDDGKAGCQNAEIRAICIDCGREGSFEDFQANWDFKNKRWEARP